MGDDFVLSIGSEAIKVIMMLAGPMLIAAMVIGIIVSILQAITQINESTLTFIPKMIAVIAVLVVMAPWMMEVMQGYATEIFGNFADYVK